jgi:integrase
MMATMKTARALDSWVLDLRAQAKSARTIETYTLAARQLGDFLDDPEIDEITTGDIRRFIDDHITRNSDSTANQRYGSLSVFFGWLIDEGEIEQNPMLRIKRPKVAMKPVPLVDERVFERLLDTCDSSFRGKRDRAILLLFWDCGIRRGEITSITVDDIDWHAERVRVWGKGAKFRDVPYTARTASALNRYDRARDNHKLASEDGFWLGERGVLTGSGLYQMVTKRVLRFDLPHIYPHQFRHSLTDRLLSSGVDGGDTMTILGWGPQSRSMLDRYASIRKADRAIESYRRHIG